MPLFRARLPCMSGMISSPPFLPRVACPCRPTLWRNFPVPPAPGLTFPPPNRRSLNYETPPFGSLACRNFDHCREHCPDNARAGDPGVRRQQLCAEPADRGANPPADQQPDPVAAERGVDADRSDEHTPELPSLMRTSYAV